MLSISNNPNNPVDINLIRPEIRDTSIIDADNAEVVLLTEQIASTISEVMDGLELTNIEENQDLPSAQEINNLGQEVDTAINAITQPIVAEIDQIFATPNNNPTDNIRESLKAIKREHTKIQTDLAIRRDSLVIGQEVAEYLQFPMEGLLVGLELAEKFTNQLGGVKELAAISNEVDNAALGLIGTGIKCFVIQKQGQIISDKEKHKEGLVARLQRETSQEIKNILEDEIEFLETEISNLKEEFTDQIKEVSAEFIKFTFDQSSEILDMVASSSHLIATHAAVIAKLAIASSSISIAGALVSLGWSTYQTYNSSSELIETNKKMKFLVKEIKSTTDPEKAQLVYIMQAKLDRLKNAQQNREFALANQTLNLSASSLALSLAVKGVLVASGVTIGATAGTVLTAAGATGIVLLAGTTAVGTGVVAYKKRNEIKYAAQIIPNAAQKIIINQQLNRCKKINMKAVEQLIQSNEELNTNLLEQRKIQTIPENIEELLTRKNPQAQQKQLLSNMQTIMSKINQATEEKVSSQSMIRNLSQKLEDLDKKSGEIKADLTMKQLGDKFKNYDITTVNIIRKVVEKGLTNPQTNAQIKEFLKSEGQAIKGQATWNDVLNYIVE